MSLQPRSLFSSSLWPFAIAIALLPLGCAAPTSDASQMSHAALDQDGDDPESDEDLAFLMKNGFGSAAFAKSCVSMKEGGPSIETDPLPVGGGRWISCETFGSLARATTGALSATGEHWCALGEATSFHGVGDSRLAITVASTPANAPWTLKATHDGDEIQIASAEMFGARVWPIWVELGYRVLELKREAEGKSCDEVFGL